MCISKRSRINVPLLFSESQHSRENSEENRLENNYPERTARKIVRIWENPFAGTGVFITTKETDGLKDIYTYIYITESER